ncbi:MAG: class I SAM-dependent methyltransferase [Thermomicrobiales bacterium]
MVERASFNEEVREIWDQNAAFWNERMGEGNAFHLQLVLPSIERLLDLQPGETVLELACGNGQLARQLARHGVQITATDFSGALIEIARDRTAQDPDLAGRITFQVLDATDETALLALGEQRFDAVVCSMAIMDMADIRPMMQASARLLKPGGRFVFALTHPCFNHTGIVRTIEEEDREGEIVRTYGIKVVRYLTNSPQRGLAMIGQPVPHYYFDRPLSILFGEAFAAGFVVDGLLEPSFAAEEEGNRTTDWQQFKEIPPVLVARLRILGPGV